MAALITIISLNAICLPSIDEITVNGLEYPYPVHILLIRILMPGAVPLPLVGLALASAWFHNRTIIFLLLLVLLIIFKVVL